MFFKSFKSAVGTTCLLGIGIASIIGEKMIRERGPEFIIEPAQAVIQQLQPIGAAIAVKFADVSKSLGAEDATVTDPGSLIATPGAVPAVAPDADGTASAEAALLSASETQTAPVEQVLRVVETCNRGGDDIDVVVLGDRLGLRFFEQSALASTPSVAGTAIGESIVFERLDLSGSYEVGASGAISLPAIGHVDVIGRKLSCVEMVVARATSERLRVNASVSAAFAARPPVLVRGTVRAPGAHTYSPGLTVERVLAQAGAIDGSEPMSSIQLASLSAREEELGALAANLFVERARFDAALTGDTGFAEDLDAWSPVTDAIGLDRVESERALLLSQLAEHAAEDLQMNDRIDDLVWRIEAAQENLRAADDQLSYLTARSEKLAALFAKGLVNEAKVEEAELRRMDMARVVLDKRDALLGTEGDLGMARRTLDVRRAERQRLLTHAVRDAGKEGLAVQEQLRVVRAQLGLGRGSTEAMLMVTIERPDRDGTTRLEAAPDTAVRPGDLVTVGPAPEQAAPKEVPASAAPLQGLGALTRVVAR